MSQRISLDTLDGTTEAKPAFASCAFAAGETAEAPECSRPIELAEALSTFERESARGHFDTGRYRMTYRVWGEGPAIVIVPGLCDDSLSYVLPSLRLKKRFCVITYDLPAGGDDGARLANYSQRDLVDDLVGLTRHLRIESTIVMGVSFGSTIALEALAEHPKRFTIGILQGGFAHRPLAPAEILLARFARYWRAPLERLPLFHPVVDRVYARDFEPLESSRWPYFLRRYGQIPMRAVAHRALLLHQADLRPRLPEIRQPVMMIVGDRDPLVHGRAETELHAGLPNVVRAEIENCGHVPVYTHPEVLCEVIEQFLGAS